jgi:hypothetical protein
LENKLEKQRLFETCLIWARRKENGTTIRSVIMQRIGWFTLNTIAYQLLNKFKERLKGNKGEKTTCHHPSLTIARPTYVGI